MAMEGKKGRITFRTAAVLFFISAAFELLAAGTAVPLLGGLREGGAAYVYHLVYTVLFAALGMGLWGARPWGYPLVFAAAALYTLDKWQMLASDAAMNAVVAQMHAALESSLPGIEMAMVSRTLVLMLALFVLGWWGFALYTWWRRDYFRKGGA